MQIAPPDPILGPLPTSSIVVVGPLWKEGLYSVHTPSLAISRPCVFKSTGWARGSLLARELLHVFDTPLTLIQPVLKSFCLPLLALACTLLPRVGKSLFYTIWLDNYGGGA